MYNEDKIFSIYIQVESHTKRNDLEILKMATILTSVYMFQKLWSKTSIFDKNAKKIPHKMGAKKDT